MERDGEHLAGNGAAETGDFRPILRVRRVEVAAKSDAHLGRFAAFAVKENANVRIGMRTRRGLAEQVKMHREQNRRVGRGGE